MMPVRRKSCDRRPPGSPKRAARRQRALLGAAFVATLWSSGCVRPSSPLLRQTCLNPDAQLASVLQPLEALRAKGCDAGVTRECDRLLRELERLTVICPAHAPTLMANAVIAYDEQLRAKSQQLLDQILAQSRSYPDAAVLRAQIAVEEGNLPFARRLLEQHIKLAPDHAGLYETFGATLYLQRQLPEARQALTTAAALGAPKWRTAYHLGLVEEASGRFEEALRYYAEALAGKPGWAPAQSHLNGLRGKTAK